MKIDEIIEAAKASKEAERTAQGRYRLTLADLALLRRIRGLRRVQEQQRRQWVRAMYNADAKDAPDSPSSRDTVRSMAEDALQKRAREAERVRQSALQGRSKGT